MSSLTKQTRISSPTHDLRTTMIEAREARIGPNSVLQLMQVLDGHLGKAAARALLLDAGLAALPVPGTVVGGWHQPSGAPRSGRPAAR